MKSRDTWLAASLLILLTIITVASAIPKSAQTAYPRLSSLSPAPDGAKALRLWLEGLGYPIQADPLSAYRPAGDTAVVLLLEPTQIIARNEWEILDLWIEAGGSLIVAGDGEWTGQAMGHFGFELEALEAPVEDLIPQSPLFSSPPLGGPARARAGATLQSKTPARLVLLAVESGPVVVSFPRGRGQVILCAAPYAFSNTGLKEPGAPALVLNLVAAAAGQAQTGRGGVWFDEWHHGLRSPSQSVNGPSQWLFRTASGRALLLAAALGYLALLLQGRSFGRPLSMPKEAPRRAPLEYITALANLSRRAGHRADILQKYYQQIKRGLGQRYRISPDLWDAEWVARLAQSRPEIPQEELLGLLKDLRRLPASESEFVSLARQAASWIDRYTF